MRPMLYGYTDQRAPQISVYHRLRLQVSQRPSHHTGHSVHESDPALAAAAPPFAIFEREYNRKRNIPLPHIAPRRFANLLLRPAQIQEIVLNLKGHADVISESIQAVCDLAVRIRDQCSELATDGNQERRFAAYTQKVPSDVLIGIKEITNLLHFPDGHLDHRLGENLMNLRSLQVGRQLQRLAVYIVAGIHGNPVVPTSPLPLAYLAACPHHRSRRHERAMRCESSRAARPHALACQCHSRRTYRPSAQKQDGVACLLL